MKKAIFLYFLFWNLCAFAQNFVSIGDYSKEFSEKIKKYQGKNNKKLKLAVFDFQYLDGFSGVGSAKIRESFTVNLSKNGLTVLERKMLDKILEEKKIERTGAFDEKTISDLATLAGADAILAGTMEDLDGEKTKISLRVVDIVSGFLITADEIYVKRDWDKYEPRMKKADEAQKIISEIKFEIEKLPDLKFPYLNSEEVKMNFGQTDIEKLKKYDETVDFERKTTDYVLVAQKWEQLAREVPEYKLTAEERSKKLRKYVSDMDEYKKKSREFEINMNKDYEKLMQILKLQVVDKKKKNEFAQSFINTYANSGYHSPELVKYRQKLREYTISPCVDALSNKIGFCYPDGSLALPGKYEEARYFNNGIALVKLAGKWTIINSSGDELFSPKYEGIDDSFRDDTSYVLNISFDFVPVSLSDKWGFINKKGVEITPIKYDKVFPFSSDLAAVCLDGEWGAINEKGEEIISPKYEKLFPFNGEYAVAFLDGKMLLVSKNGFEIQMPEYDTADYVYLFSEGLVSARFKGKWGFVDESGKQAIKPQYDSAFFFSSGLSNVCLNKKCGYINKYGNFVIPAVYDEASLFMGDYARVKINGKYGFINKSGAYVIQPSYEDAEEFIPNMGLFCVKKHKYWGCIDTKRKIIIPFSYEHISSSSDSDAILEAAEPLQTKDGNEEKDYSPDAIQERNHYYLDRWGRTYKIN